MPKVRQSNKETKKQPVLSLKEKRAAKKSTKDTKTGIPPIIPR